MWKAVKSTALIDNVDGISAILVTTVFETGSMALGPAVAIFLPAPPPHPTPLSSVADLALRLQLVSLVAGSLKSSEEQRV